MHCVERPNPAQSIGDRQYNMEMERGRGTARTRAVACCIPSTRSSVAWTSERDTGSDQIPDPTTCQALAIWRHTYGRTQILQGLVSFRQAVVDAKAGRMSSLV